MDIKAKKKMMMTTALLFVICLMTIVCSSYDQEMIVNGQAYLRVDEEIRVVDLKMLSVKDGGFETYNCQFAKASNHLYVTLPQLTSEVTYQVKVNNKSSYLYVISEIKQNLDNDDMKVVIDGYKIGEGIDRKSELTFNVTVKYSDELRELPSNTKAIITINYKFEKPYAAILSYDNEISKSRCSDVQCALDDLYDLLGG